MSDPATPRPPLLDVAGLHVWRGEHPIVRDVSFTVPDRGVTALLGRNGVGKTTTLLGLLGLLRRAGAVRLAGQEVAGLRTHRIVQLGVGYVPEDREVFAGLSVAENLRLAARSANPDYDRVFELFPDLKERWRQRAGTLSGGQQQMVALARPLLSENRLWLVDEPTKGLAPALVAEVTDALARLADRVPMLLVEQNLAVVTRLADTAVVLDQGSVVWAGAAATLLADAALVHELLGVSRRSAA